MKIGQLEIDPSRNLLECDADCKTVEPKIMDVLCTLAERPGETVTRSELIECHWGIQFGGDESLTRAISILRKTFKSLGSAEGYIETIPKRGYRLAQPVKSIDARTEATATRNADAGRPSNVTTAPRQTTTYSVVVVPLRCASGSAEERLAEDIGHDLVGMLSRTPCLRVAAYDHSLKDRLTNVDVGALGRSLGVHYVVSGAIVRDGDRLAIRIELIDDVANRHLLSWKFHDQVAQFESRLDKFILDLSTPIISEIQIAEASMAHLSREANFNALQIIQSTEIMRNVYNEKRAHEIVEHLNYVIEREPDNALAYASLAVQLAQNVTSYWSASPEKDFASASFIIDKARRLAPRDADVDAATGIVAFMMGDDEKAGHFLARSLEKNPNNPHVFAMLGLQRGVQGGDREGIRMIRLAEKRAPNHPRYPIWAHYRGLCEGNGGRLEDAAAAQRQATNRNPNYWVPYLSLGLGLAVLHREDEARAAVDRARALSPAFTFENLSEMLTRWSRRFPTFESDRFIEAARQFWPR